ncbi:hypothetical protein ACJJIF_12985 [Microbulbifer sp. SSSA002]|uniref:hypothetical protein n=1 Tax=unclassified Microbulbifer TaxID=2619833 RepID=UPI004039B39A
MGKTIYSAPESELESAKSTKVLSPSEKLAESRRQMEESNAIQTLNFIWGLRLILNIIAILFITVGAITSYNIKPTTAVVALSFTILFCGTEIFCIIGYFRRKAWCQVPLHIFSAFSLFNLPLGTILSILHYFKMPKVRFDQ